MSRSMMPMSTAMRKNERLYRAHVRLHALVSLISVAVVVLMDAPPEALWITGGVLALLWGGLVYVRLHAEPPSEDRTYAAKGPPPPAPQGRGVRGRAPAARI